MDNVSSYVISIVVTAPASSDLVDAETVMDDWQIDATDLSFVTRTISRCSVAVQQFCNRQFGVTTYQDTFRLEQGYRTGRVVNGARNPIKLVNWPIVGITSVTTIAANGTTTTLAQGADFEADSATGVLYRLNPAQQPRDWAPIETVVVYQAGYLLPGQNGPAFPAAQSLPLDIQDAVSRMVFSRYAERRRDPFIKAQELPGGGRTEYIVGNPNNGDGGNMSPDVADILNNYRTPIVG